MSQERIEAASRAIAEQDRRRPNSFHQAQARDALQAADAHDAAHGVHRVSLDDATVERAARAMLDAMYDDKTLKVDDGDRGIIRDVIAAAAKEEQ